jgi:hypothetical protein
MSGICFSSSMNEVSAVKTILFLKPGGLNFGPLRLPDESVGM